MSSVAAPRKFIVDFFVVVLVTSLQQRGLALSKLDSLINIYSHVTVASSSVLQDEGIKFIPEWAIDRVESTLWSNCFVSQREPTPWWRIDLGKQETIGFIRIHTRQYNSSHQPDVKLSDMNGLTIYVDDVNDTAGGSHTQQCGSVLKITSRRSFGFRCGSGLTGRYVHVIVPSFEPKYLAICKTVFNFVDHGRLLHATLQGQSHVIQPKEDPTRPYTLASDDNKTTCASTNTTSTSQSWTFRFSKPTFISRLILYANLNAGGTYTIFGEGQLVKGGPHSNRSFGSYAASHDHNVAQFTRWPRLFLQYITMSLTSKTPLKLEVCDIELYGASVLDVYSPAMATALTQLSSSNLMSKAIDQSLQTTPESCYRSTQQANTWWRLELPIAAAISYVFITTIPDSSSLSEMDGFRVFIGNNTSNSGRSNQECGSPWVKPSGIVSNITVTCAGKLVGKYVYIVASNRPAASLSLCEVQLFNDSDPVIDETSDKVGVNSSRQTTLRCIASGRPTPRIVWTEPGGETVNATTHVQTGSSVTSTLTVSDRKRGGNYTCTAYNGRSNNATASVVKCDGLFVPFGQYSTIASKNGKRVKFFCDEGYQLIGLSTAVCLQSGKWTKIPACLPVKCGRPTVHKGVVASSTEFVFPKVIGFKCPPGYTLQGPKHTQCQANRMWSHPSPRCQNKEFPCGCPPRLSNATLLTNWNTAEYKCDNGLQPEKQTITCLENGQWSKSLQQCRSPTCSLPQPIPYGAVSFISRKRSGVAQYRCSVCYSLIGSRERRCQLMDDGKSLGWSGIHPACRIVRCGNPPPLENGSVQVSKNGTCGSMATYECNSGFLLLGNDHLVCAPEGVWSSPKPRCIIWRY